MRQPICWILIILYVICGPSSAGTPHGSSANSVSPETARRLLDDGNARFVAGSTPTGRKDQDRRCETFTGGQHPYAIVLSCADSRAPVEYIFDAGVGDLFVVRVAGNVANADEIGSIEYAVEHLGAPLIVVLGHSKCGAVTAVVEHAHVSESIAKLVAPIAPAVGRAQEIDPKLTGPALVAAAIRENVRQSISDMVSRSEIIRAAVEAKNVEIIGGVYDLHTGAIAWLDPKPVEANADHDAHADVHAPVAEHAKPIHETESTAHEAHEPASPAPGPAHSEDPHKPHDDKSNDGEEEHTSSATHKQPRENYAALGGLLGGAAVVSTVAIRFMSNRRG